jgi:hypothetical protein
MGLRIRDVEGSDLLESPGHAGRLPSIHVVVSSAKYHDVEVSEICSGLFEAMAKLRDVDGVGHLDDDDSLILRGASDRRRVGPPSSEPDGDAVGPLTNWSKSYVGRSIELANVVDGFAGEETSEDFEALGEHATSHFGVYLIVE